MFYRACFKKEKTFWWDEDKYGECLFAANSDAEATRFVLSACQIMNKRYKEIQEPREVKLTTLTRLSERGFSTKQTKVFLVKNEKPFDSKVDTKKFLNTFFPQYSEMGVRQRSSIVGSFHRWELIKFPKIFNMAEKSR